MADADFSDSEGEWSEWSFELESERHSDVEDSVDSEGNSDEETDQNAAALERKTAELQTVLHMLDLEDPSYDFQSTENTRNYRPAFTADHTGANCNLPDTATPLDYFQLFYTNDVLDQVGSTTTCSAIFFRPARSIY